MRIRNAHRRPLPVPAREAGRLIDGLAGRPDPLWPAEHWPAMRFDGPLAEGAVGGHGPIRYRVEAYRPGERVSFRFEGPPGLTGSHGFTVQATPGGCVLGHTLEGGIAGRMLLAWPLFFRPLHDALIEDALDKAEAALTGTAARPARWSRRVRLLRRLGR